MITLLAALTVAADEAREFGPDDFEYFEKTVRPLLSEHCYECHAAVAKTVHGGLRLDSAAALRAGGDSGAVIDPGRPETSLLIEALEYDGDVQMPPEGKLPETEIATLREWVRRGAPFPPDADQPHRPDGTIDFEAGRNWWSFQPAARQPLPPVKQADWPRKRIDRFVLAAMEREGLSPSPRADRATLIRRLYFDLIGLPPEPEDVAAFVSDESPAAWESLVERLLQSPQYGEKWARFWLDCARYTDHIADWLDQAGQPYLYRDWVVNAFNADMPFDDFVRRQLATDLLPETGPDDLPALGFISLSPTYWKELKLPCEIINTIVADEYEERVDAVSRTFLGLTVACARCHDHKFDPISAEDYYALAGVFASCRPAERPIIDETRYAPVRSARAEVAKFEEELAALKKQQDPPQDAVKALESRIGEIRSGTPLFDTPLASALVDEALSVERAGATPQDGTRLVYRPEAQDLHLHIRGNPNRLGPLVPRRFLTVFSGDAKPFRDGSSGRLALAKAITTDAASLAARVIVNRIWMEHFGAGLVGTPSDFGHQGELPSHPELLDDLAAGFIEQGWSVKQLHREILLSATWQQSSAYDAERVRRDPANRWLSRMNRQRLDFEAWRDAMLSASGTLDLTSGGRSQPLEDRNHRRRTLYGTIEREEPLPTLQMHDVPDPTQHSPQRTPTTTAIQSLYALNGPLLTQQSELLAARVLREFPADCAARMERLWWLLYSRNPSLRERTFCQEFLEDVPDDQQDNGWAQLAHVLLASNEFLYLD